jgi:hypothetical protein
MFPKSFLRSRVRSQAGTIVLRRVTSYRYVPIDLYQNCPPFCLSQFTIRRSLPAPFLVQHCQRID